MIVKDGETEFTMPRKNEPLFLECHATVHDWDEISVLKEPSFGVAFDYRCTKCYSIKRVIVSRMSGMVLSRYYKHVEGYKAPVEMSKADYRKIWIEKKLREVRNLKVV